MREQRFTVPNRLASYGEMLRTAQDSDSLRARERHNIHLVQWAVQNEQIKPVDGTVELYIKWVEPTSHRKHADVAAGSALIERALVAAGILDGDSETVIGIYSTFATNAERPRVEVTLKEYRYGFL